MTVIGHGRAEVVLDGGGPEQLALARRRPDRSLLDQGVVQLQAQRREVARVFGVGPAARAHVTVEGQDDLDAVLAAIDADRHAVARLEAEPATLRRRIVEREPDGWAGLDELLAAAERLAPVIAHIDGIALALSTECDRPEAVAERIRDAFPAELRPGSLSASSRRRR
jgi:hypothetical protein